PLDRLQADSGFLAGRDPYRGRGSDERRFRRLAGDDAVAAWLEAGDAEAAVGVSRRLAITNVNQVAGAEAVRADPCPGDRSAGAGVGESAGDAAGGGQLDAAEVVLVFFEVQAQGDVVGVAVAQFAVGVGRQADGEASFGVADDRWYRVGRIV